MKISPIYYVVGAALLGGGLYWYYRAKKQSGELGGTFGTYKGHWWKLQQLDNGTWGYAVGMGAQQVPLATDSPFTDVDAARTAAFQAIDQMTEGFSGLSASEEVAAME